MLKSTIFREYDIRGIAETDLLSPGVEVLGKAIGTYFIRKAGSNAMTIRSSAAADLLPSNSCSNRPSSAKTTYAA